MKIRNRRRLRNATFPLPLFSWADACDRWRDAPRAARIILHGFRLTPTRALLLAELAELGGAG